jgi:DNA repair protein RadA/Sms
MSRTSSTYRCSSCGADHLRWQGKCSRCQTFGSVEEIARPDAPAPGLKANLTGKRPIRKAAPITEVSATGSVRISSMATEFDRVLGGGLVRGQVVLLAGEPGVGKSTLLLAVANAFAGHSPDPVLYVSGEESAEQIGVRARRIAATANNLLVANETDLGTVLGHVEEHQPALLVVDSVQTLASPQVDGRAGGVSQVHEVAAVLTKIAKSRGMPALLVGQSTKENSVAGPRALEHLVDTVLTFEGDPHSSMRTLRATKNRFGPADEVVCYEQTDTGLTELADPSTLFRSHRDKQPAGACATVTMEGRRPILAEIQALVTEATSSYPRRAVTGFEQTRATMLTAVCDRAAQLSLHQKDVYLSTAAGLRLTDPAIDLATCLALVSAAIDRPLPDNMVAFGEVALSGDIRPVPAGNARLAEASRLGFHVALTPRGAQAPPGIEHAPVAHLSDALAWLLEYTTGP